MQKETQQVPVHRFCLQISRQTETPSEWLVLECYLSLSLSFSLFQVTTGMLPLSLQKRNNRSSGSGQPDNTAADHTAKRWFCARYLGFLGRGPLLYRWATDSLLTRVLITVQSCYANLQTQRILKSHTCPFYFDSDSFALQDWCIKFLRLVISG